MFKGLCKHKFTQTNSTSNDKKKKKKEIISLVDTGSRWKPPLDFQRSAHCSPVGGARHVSFVSSGDSMASAFRDRHEALLRVCISHSSRSLARSVLPSKCPIIRKITRGENVEESAWAYQHPAAGISPWPQSCSRVSLGAFFPSAAVKSICPYAQRNAGCIPFGKLGTGALLLSCSTS